MVDRRSSLPPRPSQANPSQPRPAGRINTMPLDLDAVDLVVPEDHHLVLSWAEALDQADYLALLDLAPPREGEPGPNDEEIIDAFHTFAERFHPDSYADAPHDVREAALAVFRRGAEAYRVLRDVSLRQRYYRLLEAGTLRMSPEEIAHAEKGERKRPDTARQAVKTAAAAPFAAEADAQLAAGDLKKARLQLQLATMKEPDNEDLAAMLLDVEARLAARS
ncbi:MAG: hypothetical protein HYV09_08050 [Deltaproteobacteria bacterium]|nr:hypothetical protein [Deltaproteobacteria bacterium]